VLTNAGRSGFRAPRPPISLHRMRRAATVFLGLLLSAGTARGQSSSPPATFEEALRRRSIADLRSWREQHAWSFGDRLAGFFERLLATRSAGDHDAVERVQLDAAFLAEAVAEDPFSGWLLQILRWDVEACAREETALSLAAELPGMVAAGEADAAWSQVDELRDHLTPPGGWPLLAPDLTRLAAALFHRGDRERAGKLASALLASSEELRRGGVLAANERILAEIARESGALDEAERRTTRSAEVAAGLDSGEVGRLAREIEGLEATGIDVLLEIHGSEKASLVVAVGGKATTAVLLDLGPEGAAAKGLGERLLQQVAPALAGRVGVVCGGTLASLPVEGLALPGDPPKPFGASTAVVRLSRAPIGAWIADPAPAAGTLGVSGTLVVLDAGGRSAAAEWLERQTSGPLAPVRSVHPKTAEDLAREAAGARILHFDLVPDAKGLRARADLAVLARPCPSPEGLVEALHAAGVRDVLYTPGSAGDGFLVRFYEHLAKGEEPAQAAASARAAGSQAQGAWVLHRRS